MKQNFYQNQVYPRTFWKKHVFCDYKGTLPGIWVMSKINRKIMKSRLLTITPVHGMKKLKDLSKESLRGWWEFNRTPKCQWYSIQTFLAILFIRRRDDWLDDYRLDWDMRRFNWLCNFENLGKIPRRHHDPLAEWHCDSHFEIQIKRAVSGSRTRDATSCFFFSFLLFDLSLSLWSLPPLWRKK